MDEAISMGIIPKRLASIKRRPMCAACQGAKVIRTPWRSKGQHDNQILGHLRQATAPGEIFFVEQSESSTPGFMVLLRGQPTRR